MVKLTKNTYLKLALIVVLCVVLCGGIAGASVAGCAAAGDVLDPPSPPQPPSAPEAPAFYAENGYTEVLNADLSPDEFRNLSIDWAAGSAAVRVVSDDQTGGAVRVIERIRGNVPQDQYLTYSIDGDWLNIDYFKATPLLFFGCMSMGSKHLEVLIPRSAAEDLGELYLDAASGSYVLDGAAFERVNLSMASGKVEGAGLSAESLDVELASGHVDLAGRVTDTVAVSAASGDVALRLDETMPGSMDVDCASGSMVFQLPADSGFTALVDKVSGSFNCAFPARQHDDAYVVGDGAAKVTVSMTSGSVTFEPAASA